MHATFAAKNLLIVAFIAFWLLPVFYYAAANSPAPWLTEFFQRRTNVARLFSSEVPVWAIYAVQYRIGRETQYRFLTEESFFRMKPFGRRTRLQKIVSISGDREREELSRWLHERLQRNIETPITSIRIVAFPNTVTSFNSGAGYTQPSPPTIDESVFRTVSQVDFPAP